ncbi:hypothetical protein BG011_008324, partial [Mortierella polycephala]
DNDIIMKKPRDATTLAPVFTPASAPVPARAIAIVIEPASVTPTATPTAPAPEKAIYCSLAVKHMAVYQPTFKFRRWVEGRKNIVPTDSPESISNLEYGLPALRGEGASVINYVEELEKVEERLDTFYNGDNMRYKRHKWDAMRAPDTKYAAISNSLLKVVGGNIGQQREDANKVVIAVGLDQFSTKTRFSSLHELFLSFFVQKIRMPD